MKRHDLNKFFIGKVDEEFLNYAAEFFPEHIGVGIYPDGYWLVRVDKLVKSLPKLKKGVEFLTEFTKKLNAVVMEEIVHAIAGDEYIHKPCVQISIPEDRSEEIKKEIDNYLKNNSDLFQKGDFIYVKNMNSEAYDALVKLALYLKKKGVRLKLSEERDLNFFYSLI
jgi:hypothetical protein